MEIFKAIIYLSSRIFYTFHIIADNQAWNRQYPPNTNHYNTNSITKCEDSSSARFRDYSSNMIISTSSMLYSCKVPLNWKPIIIKHKNICHRDYHYLDMLPSCFTNSIFELASNSIHSSCKNKPSACWQL